LNRTTVSVSVQGDRNYTRALRVLADRLDKTVGELVREALDQVHGQRLQPILIFFACDEQQNVSEMNFNEESVQS
jgi:hypothetical protein